MSQSLSLLPQLLLNALTTGSLYALAATGMTLTYISFRVLNFAHGALVMIGAYLFYALTVQVVLPSVLLSAMALVLVGYLCAWFVHRCFFAPFIAIHPVLPCISTLALAMLIEATISMLFGVSVLSLSTEVHDAITLPFQLSLTNVQCFFIVTSIVSLSAIALYVRHSSFGRQLQALAESPTYLAALGVSIAWRQRATLFIAILLAFFAGIFLGFEANLQPLMGSSIMIKACAAMVVSGMTSLYGAILGSFIIAFAESLIVGLDLGVWSIPASYRDTVALVLVLCILLLKPAGLFRNKGRAV
jgi:branched-subunit amino acid ABC-type transport system permease component